MQLRAQDLRVASVAYRLSIANAARCGSALAPQPGFVLHSIEQYDSSERDRAAGSYRLGERIGVMAVVAGSPADRAGLAADDALLAVNGSTLPLALPGGSRLARADQAQAMLVAAMRSGATRLRIERRDGIREVVVTAQSGCPVKIELIAGGDMNAWANGNAIMIGGALLRSCANDDDLAFVIGHEMAHNLLHHRQRLADHERVARLLPTSNEGSTSMRQTEEEADRLAVQMATWAGYDLSGTEQFLSRLLQQRPPSATHPVAERRLALLRAAIAAVDQRPGGGERVPSMANTASSDLVSGMM